MKAGSVSIVIPCHDERDSVLRCLGSITSSGVECRTFLIDDGSSDGVGEAVAQQFPAVRVIRGDGSMWWSGAINAGLTEALRDPSDYYLMLNNDCTLSRDAVDRLVAAARASADTIVSAVIYDDNDGAVVSFGGKIGAKGLDYIMERRPTDHAGLFTVDWLPGHCLLVPAAVLERIGLVDAKAFPHYWADADFTLRARRAGFRLAVQPDIQVHNDRAQTGLRIADSTSLRSLLQSLRSRRSWLKVDENAKFWWRHRDYVALRAMLTRYSSISVLIGRRMAEKLHIRPAVRWLVHRLRRTTN